MLETAAVAIVLGLGAGVSPGPLFGLLVLASVRGGLPAGTRVAVTPLLTDLPVVVLSLTAVSRLPDAWLVGLSVVGGMVVVWFGWQALRAARAAPVDDPVAAARQSWWQAIVVNILSPHPWLFWIGVGAPIMVAAWDDEPAAAVAFLVLFYVALVGSKFGIATVVAAGRHRLGATARRRLAVAAGVLMVVTGVGLVAGPLIG